MSNEKAVAEMNVKLANYQTRLWEALGKPNTTDFIRAVKALTAEVDALKDEVARLSAPVTEAEVAEYGLMIQPVGEDTSGLYFEKETIEEMLAARATPPQDVEKS